MRSEGFFDPLASLGGQGNRLVHPGFLQSRIAGDITQALHLTVESSAKSAHGQVHSDHHALMEGQVAIHRLANP